MESTNEEIFGLAEFLTAIAPYPSGVWIFRGQADESWPLQPRASRAEFFCDAWSSPPLDLLMFDEWREHAVVFSPSVPMDDFECLAYAQHYGLATRLLDWTSNPMVALYFAVETHAGANGAVFAHWPSYFISPKVAELADLDHLAAYMPRPFDRRLLSQSAVFTYHPHPEVALTPGALKSLAAQLCAPQAKVDTVKIVIRSEAKPLLFAALEGIGVNRRALFPDLEGLSASTNWRTKMRASKMGPCLP